MLYSYLPYAVSEVFCAAFAVAILFRLNGSIGSEHEVMELKRIVYAYLGMLVTDIFWALNEDGIVVLNPLVNAADNAILLICVTLGCFFWFKYVEDRLHQETAPTRSYNIITAIPLIVVCVLDVVSIYTGWIFHIDEFNHYQASDILFIIPAVVNYLYLLIPTIGSLLMAQKTKSRALRREYLSYPAYMIIPLICGLLEDTMPNVPILALNILMVILIFFLALQSRQVSADALTGLNNRRWLSLFLEKRLATASTDEPVALFIIDINDFESINDRFGHIEGDIALKSFANALRLAASRYNAFVARYGSDEFCLVANVVDNSPEEIERGIGEILETARSVMGNETKPYTLSVCVGYAICDHPETRVSAFISRAYDVLEDRKRQWRDDKPEASSYRQQTSETE